MSSYDPWHRKRISLPGKSSPTSKCESLALADFAASSSTISIRPLQDREARNDNAIEVGKAADDKYDLSHSCCCSAYGILCDIVGRRSGGELGPTEIISYHGFRSRFLYLRPSM